MSAWHVEGKDGFDLDADYYLISEHESYPAAREAARRVLQELDRSQPCAGGQGGIQDRVYLVGPDGAREQVYG